MSGTRLVDHRSPLAALNGENSREKSRMSVKIAPFTRINIELTIQKKKIEDSREGCDAAKRCRVTRY